jgi:hypothetical protein
MGNVPYLTPPTPISTKLTHPLDPLPNRPNPHHRHPKNPRLLRAQAKMERHARVRHWHHIDPHEVGILWLHNRVIRHTGAVWRLLCDDCGVRWWDTNCGAIYCTRVAGVEWGGKESGECGVKGRRERKRGNREEKKRKCIILAHARWGLDEWHRRIGIRISGRRIARIHSYSSSAYTCTQRLQTRFQNKSNRRWKLLCLFTTFPRSIKLSAAETRG